MPAITTTTQCREFYTCNNSLVRTMCFLTFSSQKAGFFSINTMCARGLQQTDNFFVFRCFQIFWGGCQNPSSQWITTIENTFFLKGTQPVFDVKAQVGWLVGEGCWFPNSRQIPLTGCTSPGFWFRTGFHQ